MSTEISVDKESFVEALEWVLRPAELGVEDFLEFQYDPEGLRILHGGQAEETRANVAIEGQEGEEFTEKFLCDSFKRSLPALKRAKGDSFTLSLGKTSLKVSGKSLNLTFPKSKKRSYRFSDYVDIGQINNNEFMSVLKSFAVVADPGSTMTRSITLAKHDEKSVKLVATDRYLLVERVIPALFSNEGLWQDFFIPRASATKYATITDEAEDVTLVYSEDTGRLGFQYLDGRLVLFSLEAAQSFSTDVFHQRAREANSSIIVDSSDMKNAFSQISAIDFAQHLSWLVIDDSGAKFQNQSGDNVIAFPVNAREDITQEVKLIFSKETLSKALKIAHRGPLKIKWKKGVSSVFFAHVDGDGQERDGELITVSLANL